MSDGVSTHQGDDVVDHSSIAALGQVARWGQVGTPILPRYLCEAIPRTSAPRSLRTSDLSHIEQLGDYWSTNEAPLRTDQLDDLVELFRKHPPPDDYEITPAQVVISTTIPSWPLRNRTRNGLMRLGTHADGRAFTVGDFLQVPNLGVKSLIELMCVAEAALGPGRSPALRSVPVHVAQLEPSIVLGALRPLLSAAAEFDGARTLGDVFELDLNQLASDLGISDSLAGLRFSDEIDDEWFTDDLVCRVDRLLADLTAMEQTIMELRLYQRHRATLEEVGSACGVTRERIRQVEKRLIGRLQSVAEPRLGATAAILRHRIGPVASEQHFNAVVNRTFRTPTHQSSAPTERSNHDLIGSTEPQRPSTPDGDQSVHPTVAMLRTMLIDELNYSCHDGFYLNDEADAVVAKLRSSPRDDAWLVDESVLIDLLPDPSWSRYWDVLLVRAGFYRFGSQLAAKDSTKARVKAAMIDLGRPATKEEIAESAELGEDQIYRLGALLSGLDSVGRSGKDTWALLEDIDDVYEGIPAEIVQRIEEDGGATSLARLIDEIPRQFGVSESSVRTYASTSQFLIRDGSVSMADESNLSFRDFDDTIDGRTERGDPYWEFTVEERFFDGYSLLGFPPELARHLGCEPNTSIRIDISSPAHCRPISVNWRLASSTGASVGYLTDPLQTLGAAPGTTVRLVFDRDATVRFETTSKPVEATPTEDLAVDLLERLKQRRRVL